MKAFSKVAKRGCPECDGKHTKQCKQCHGKTWLFDYYDVDGQWVHMPAQTKR